MLIYYCFWYCSVDVGYRRQQLGFRYHVHFRLSVSRGRRLMTVNVSFNNTVEHCSSGEQMQICKGSSWFIIQCFVNYQISNSFGEYSFYSDVQFNLYIPYFSSAIPLPYFISSFTRHSSPSPALPSLPPYLPTPLP